MKPSLPYPSNREPVYASNVVATSHPLASQAGIDILKKGGNAVDAAIATAITLTVVEPCANGIGSDAFAIVKDGDGLHGINGSGKSPSYKCTAFLQSDFTFSGESFPSSVVKSIIESARRKPCILEPFLIERFAKDCARCSSITLSTDWSISAVY